MRIIHSSKNISDKRRIVAAEDNVFDDMTDDEPMGYDFEDEALGDQLDNIEDNLEDVQDAVEDIQEDDIAIEVDNNVVNHLIAECENCKGIFISAMIASDQEVDSISGICPLCNKDTTQQLKWIIKKYPEDNVL
jgi:hypothetical protein